MGIKFSHDNNTFHLQTKSSSYVMHVMEGDLLVNIYYGKRIEQSSLHLLYYRNISCKPNPAFSEEGGFGFSYDLFDVEYPTFGVGDYREHAIEIEDAKGVHAVDFRYLSHDIFSGKRAISGLPSAYADDDKAETLEITLRDTHTNVDVVLSYCVFEYCDAIVKSVRVINNSDKAVKLIRCMSGSISLGESDFTAVYLCGMHNRERFINKCDLPDGSLKITSINGGTGHDRNCFLAMAEKGAGESFGDVYGTALVYSGNFDITANRNSVGRSRVVYGINPVGFSWLLEAGEQFQTPEAVHIFSAEGLGGMSRGYHDFIRNHICRGEWRDRKRPLLINNWEGTGFNFTGEKILDIARDAKKIGAEMLVLDDGWFGHRDNDRSSLGDWFVNEAKLGMSLRDFVEKVNEMGLIFGLWFEPEMINEDSELYRAHPEYAMHIPGRPKVYGRHQLTLNMSIPQAVENIYKQICAVIDSANIQYIKWDMNRFMADVCNYDLKKEQQGEVYHRYMLGLYGLLERLTAEYPHILFESCSGGGGRFDMGMLCYMPQTWTSDNTDPFERLFIQTGTSLIYPPRTMGAHVSVSGRPATFRTRADIALCGTFGYELDLTKLSEQELEQMRECSEDYHRYYNLTQFGDFYRNINIFDTGDRSAWSFVAKDKSEALLVFARNRGMKPFFRETVKLSGLTADRWYTHTQSGARYLGSTLMNMGVLCDEQKRTGDCISLLMHFKGDE